MKILRDNVYLPILRLIILVKAFLSRNTSEIKQRNCRQNFYLERNVLTDIINLSFWEDKRLLVNFSLMLRTLCKETSRLCNACGVI